VDRSAMSARLGKVDIPSALHCIAPASQEPPEVGGGAGVVLGGALEVGAWEEVGVEGGGACVGVSSGGHGWK